MVAQPSRVQPPHVAVRGLEKRYGGVRALAGVDLAIARGTIHGLVGENGAGKSTLGKTITGVVAADAGTIEVDGRAVAYRSPREALQRGMTIIAQELALLPARTVIDNVFLGIEPRRASVVDRRRLRRRYDELCAHAGFALDARALVGALRTADQQKVEILRALARNAELIVMDEPTATLTADESARLFSDIRALRERGTTVVYVSHFLDEVLALADVVTIMRDGRVVRTAGAAAETSQTLISGMLGRSLDVIHPPKRPPAADAPIVCSAESISRGAAVRDVTLHVRAGEIVGLAGLIGAGRSELARAIFGADRRDGGRVLIDGVDVSPRSPRAAIRAGIAMLPESRKEQGLLMGRSGVENMTLPHLREVSGLVVSGGRQRAVAADLGGVVELAATRERAPVSDLSGGNQQKVLFAKWLYRTPRLLIVDEPTRGVDVGTKRAIYELICGLAEQGIGVLVISSELEEVLGLSHRVLVMRGGRLVAELAGAEATEQNVMGAAFGALETESEAA